jgi:nitrite reductase/ring-hydroxylating ferredoxin subunit
MVAEQPILLVKIDAQVHALGAVCSHYGAPLNEGSIVGGTIECPWHASKVFT